MARIRIHVGLDRIRRHRGDQGKIVGILDSLNRCAFVDIQRHVRCKIKCAGQIGSRLFH